MSDPGGVAAEQLRTFVECIERLNEEIKVINDVRNLKEVIKLRKMQPHEREEHYAVLGLYLHALEMAQEA